MKYRLVVYTPLETFYGNVADYDVEKLEELMEFVEQIPKMSYLQLKRAAPSEGEIVIPKGTLMNSVIFVEKIAEIGP